MSKKCWAKCLGECSDKISREHTVSASLFMSETVEVEGFDWCKEKKIIGLSSLTKKILCESHNNNSSPLDVAASNAFKALREQTKLTNDRAKNLSNNYSKKTFTIKAKLLERWLLKILINFCYKKSLYIGYDATEEGLPSNRLVNIVYGKDKFSKENGLRIAMKTGMALNFKDTVSFSPLIQDKKYIYGGFFQFRGLYIFLDLTPNGLMTPLKDIPGTPAEWHHTQLSKKFKSFKAMMPNGKVSHVVKFDWL